MKRFFIRLGYVLVVAALTLVVLEGAARALGLGDPVLYYNAAWGGLRPLPGQQVERLRGARVTIDANGYRTAHPVAPGTRRVLYLGDSVTWGGSSIDDADLFTEVAADMLRPEGPVYAMNAGVNGTSLVNQAELFVAGPDSLDALVWLFPWGDVWRSYATVGFLWPARYQPRFALVEVLDNLLMRFWLPAFRHRPPPGAAFYLPEKPLDHDVLYQADLEARKTKNLDAVRAAVAEAKRRGVPVVMGITPYLHDGALLPLPDEALAFLQEMHAQGVVRFDVAAALQRAEANVPSLYLDPVHFTKEGHRTVGKALGEVLRTVLRDAFEEIALFPGAAQVAWERRL